MPIQIDTARIMEKVSKSPKVLQLAKNAANARFQEAKDQLLTDFNAHPVTQEIEAGVGAENISNTLGGKADLFSFIGFKDGSNPTQKVRNLIDKIKLDGHPTKQINKDTISYTFKISNSSPNEEDFREASPFPWAEGRSWLFDIERGISGLGYFLRGKSKFSRSGGGIQSQYQVANGARFRPVSYWSKLVNNFVKNMQKGGK